MKQLILTFFAVILFYSLFFNNEPKMHVVDETNYIHQDAISVPNLKVVSDTMNHFAFYNMEMMGWNFYIPQYEETK